MNYEEAVAYIEETPKFTTKNKMEHTKECLKRLGNPQDKFRVIHVAGTNGKGSTCAFLTSILREAGYSCGLFTSPHLVVINERFQINEKNISDEVFLDAFCKVKELADELDIPVDKISDTLKVSGRHISVDAPFVEGEDNSLLDVLVNDDAPIADRSLMNESLAKEIDRALATLTERECEIIKMFFGIGCQEMTLEEIGDKFGLTRERVRQIKEKAIRRLRQGTRSKLLKSYLG